MLLFGRSVSLASPVNCEDPEAVWSRPVLLWTVGGRWANMGRQGFARPSRTGPLPGCPAGWLARSPIPSGGRPMLSSLSSSLLWRGLVAIVIGVVSVAWPAITVGA